MWMCGVKCSEAAPGLSCNDKDYMQVPTRYNLGDITHAMRRPLIVNLTITRPTYFTLRLYRQVQSNSLDF